MTTTHCLCGGNDQVTPCDSQLKFAMIDAPGTLVHPRWDRAIDLMHPFTIQLLRVIALTENVPRFLKTMTDLASEVNSLVSLSIECMIDSRLVVVADTIKTRVDER